MFRQEKPQAGRFRQLHQFGAELIGSPEPVADVETILNFIDIYSHLGLKSFIIKLNSTGGWLCSRNRALVDGFERRKPAFKNRICWVVA
jgi:histidyl-tRNA synthetase